jgi:hypothetical protein
VVDRVERDGDVGVGVVRRHRVPGWVRRDRLALIVNPGLTSAPFGSSRIRRSRVEPIC